MPTSVGVILLSQETHPNHRLVPEVHPSKKRQLKVSELNFALTRLLRVAQTEQYTQELKN